ncbi:hypothetical protein PHMEG_0007921 [Phytophthora megakarya]|uniref:Uncharacterized protein n=1 Tax=Phytophthora megakarya TaxID=4795 RepID=A0A225WME3_9STRA|nr:hypothetical protein PHMEG_0007921 [Phytophthora megakarya]
MLDSSIELSCKPHVSKKETICGCQTFRRFNHFPDCLFSCPCEKVKGGVFQGPDPTQKQAQSYIKRWIQKHRDDSIQ